MHNELYHEQKQLLMHESNSGSELIECQQYLSLVNADNKLYKDFILYYIASTKINKSVYTDCLRCQQSFDKCITGKSSGTSTGYISGKGVTHALNEWHLVLPARMLRLPHRAQITAADDFQQGQLSIIPAFSHKIPKYSNSQSGDSTLNPPQFPQPPAPDLQLSALTLLF